MVATNCVLPPSTILIPGVEITCQHNNSIRDILGYGIDMNVIQQWLDENYSEEKRIAKQKHIVSSLKTAFSKHGIRFDDSIDAYEGKKSEAYVAMLSNVATYPENIEKFPALANISEFYINYYTDPNSEFYVNEACDSPTISEAINLIHRAGGLAFIAHPYKYQMSDEKTIELVELAVNAGADGIEIQHSSNQGDDVEKNLRMAEKYNLLISGGSDFHGDLKPYIKLATGYKNNISVQYREIESWIRSVLHMSTTRLLNNREHLCSSHNWM
jgi:predicted metal-dependent phosphoesterase TrpH